MPQRTFSALAEPNVGAIRRWLLVVGRHRVPARTLMSKHVAMNWARRLKRVFGIQIEGCARCGGRLKIIASIEEPQVIAKILAHLKTAPDQYQCELPLGARAPPGQASLL